MYKRAGSFLEEIISNLFTRAGFNTTLNKIINGYEIDVLADVKKDYRIAVECKQYEKSHIIIRNVLHQWASKSKLINVDNMIVVIIGQIPTKEDYDLAKDLDIVLMGNDDINSLDVINNKEQLRNEINNIIRFDNDQYKKNRNKRLLKKAFWLIFFSSLIAASLILIYLNSY